MAESTGDGEFRSSNEADFGDRADGLAHPVVVRLSLIRMLWSTAVIESAGLQLVDDMSRVFSATSLVGNGLIRSSLISACRAAAAEDSSTVSGLETLSDDW